MYLVLCRLSNASGHLDGLLLYTFWWIPLPLSFCYIGGYLLVDGLVGSDCCVIWDLDLDLDFGLSLGLDGGRV